MVRVQPEPRTGLRHCAGASGISKLVEISKRAFRAHEIGGWISDLLQAMIKWG